MPQNSSVGKESAQTPTCDTGSNRHVADGKGLRYKLDYLVITGVGNTEALIDIVWAATGCHWDYENARGGTRGIYYDLILKSSSTIELAIQINSQNVSQNRYRLSIPGKPLGSLGDEQLSKFTSALHQFGGRATRLDWAIDDYNRQLDLDTVEKEAQRGNYSGARQFGVYYQKKRGQLSVSKTVYFGSFQSDKLLRFYDKNIESRGEINAIRCELQCRNALADEMFQRLCEGGGFAKNAHTICLAVCGSIDFINRSNKVLSRCDRLSWWQEFCDRVGGSVRITAKRIVRTIMEKMDWIEKQITGTLALCALCNGVFETLAWLDRHIRVKMKWISEGSNEFFKTYRDGKMAEEFGFDEMKSLGIAYNEKNKPPSENQLCLDL